MKYFESDLDGNILIVRKHVSWRVSEYSLSTRSLLKIGANDLNRNCRLMLILVRVQ